MSLSGAASAMGLPESLVQRSAEARAAETGASVDEILAAWAGGEAVSSPSSEASLGEVSQPEAETEGATSEGTTEEAQPAEDAPPEPVIQTPEPDAAPAPTAAGAPTRAPVPAEVTVAEAAHLPEVVTVPTAGIKERTNFSIPRWLVGLMLVAPLFALFALGGSATGACGEGTELAIDVISGEIVNCDGTEFTGGGAGGGAADFIALGGDLYVGAVTPASNCAGCHGADGQGSGNFPALTAVLTTFGACEDHVEWVRLGSSGWAAEYGDTYGDTNKPVGGAGQMPGHQSLTEEQLRAVAAFERVRFGGANEEETLTDCGLVEAEGEEGGEEGDGGDGVAPEDGTGEGDEAGNGDETPGEGGDAGNVEETPSDGTGEGGDTGNGEEAPIEGGDAGDGEDSG